MKKTGFALVVSEDSRLFNPCDGFKIFEGKKEAAGYKSRMHVPHYVEIVPCEIVYSLPQKKRRAARKV